MDTKSVEKIVSLVVKTGLFFAAADGKYDVKEKNFIASFIDKLSAIGPVDEVKGMLEDSINHQYLLSDIIDETNELLNDFNERERAAIKVMLLGFVEQVIAADGVQHKVEKQNLEAWWASLD